MSWSLVQHAAILFIASVHLVSLWVLIIANKHHLSRTHTWSFLLMIGGIGIWSASFSLLSLTHHYVPFHHLAFLGSGLFIIGAHIFIPSLRYSELTKHRVKIIRYLPIIIMSVIAMGTDLVIRKVSFINDLVVPENGPLFVLYLVVFFVYLVDALRMMVLILKKDNQYQRYWFLFFGLFFFGFGSFIADILAPYFNDVRFIVLGPLSSIAVTASFFKVFLEQGRILTRLLFKRFIIFAFMFATITSFYFLLLFTLHVFIGHQFEHAQVYLVGFVVTIVSSFLAIRFYEYLRQRTSKWFFHGHYKIAKVTPAIMKAMGQAQDLCELIDIFRTEVAKVLAPEDITFTFSSVLLSSSQERPLSINNQRIYLPIGTPCSYQGTMIIEKKKSGYQYSQKDYRFITILNYHLNVVLIRFSKTKSSLAPYSTEVNEQQAHLIHDIAHNLQHPITILKAEIYTLLKEQDNLHNKSIQEFEQSLDNISSFITRLLNTVSYQYVEPKKMETTSPFFERCGKRHYSICRSSCKNKKASA